MREFSAADSSGVREEAQQNATNDLRNGTPPHALARQYSRYESPPLCRTLSIFAVEPGGHCADRSFAGLPARVDRSRPSRIPRATSALISLCESIRIGALASAASQAAIA
jgi:hypothetical protein